MHWESIETVFVLHHTYPPGEDLQANETGIRIRAPYLFLYRWESVVGVVVTSGNGGCTDAGADAAAGAGDDTGDDTDAGTASADAGDDTDAGTGVAVAGVEGAKRSSNVVTARFFCRRPSTRRGNTCAIVETIL